MNLGSLAAARPPAPTQPKPAPKPESNSVPAKASQVIASHSPGGKPNTQQIAHHLNQEARDNKPKAASLLREVGRQLSASDRQSLAFEAARDLDHHDREQLSKHRGGRDFLRNLYDLATDNAAVKFVRSEVSALWDAIKSASTQGVSNNTSEDPVASDAQAIEAAYNDAIADGKSEAQAAAAATEELNDISREHADDPAYVNQVLQAARPTMDKVSEVLGENSSRKSNHGSDEDHAAIDSIITDLSEVSARGNDFTALSIATSIAGKLNNSEELHHVDDAFYSHLDEGGDSKLFNTLIGVMEGAGKGKGAEGLRDRGGGLWIVDDVIDAAKSAVSFVGGVLGDIKDFTVDVVTGVANVVTDVGEFAIDFAKGTVDVVGDAASITADKVQAAIDAAKEAGLALGEKAIGWINDRLQEAIDDAIDDDMIRGLGRGDSYEIYADLGVSAGVSVSAEAKLTVKRNDDGTYTVSAELDGGLGLGIGKKESGAGAQAQLTAGGKIEFTFANASDAIKGAETLLQTAVAGGLATSPSGGPLAPVVGQLLPSDSDFEFLKDHISAMELSVGAGASAGLDGAFAKKLGLGDKAFGDKLAGQLLGDAKLGASISAEATYRLEFKDGEPVAVVRKQTLTVSGEAAAKSPAIRAKLEELGIDVPDLDASGNISIEIESRVPIEGGSLDSLSDIGALFNNADLLPEGANIENKVTVSADATLSDQRKVSVQWEITEVEYADIPDVIGALFSGDYDVIEEEIDITQTTAEYEIDELDIEIPFGVGSIEIGRVEEDRVDHDKKKVA